MKVKVENSRENPTSL